MACNFEKAKAESGGLWPEYTAMARAQFGLSADSYIYMMENRITAIDPGSLFLNDEGEEDEEARGQLYAPDEVIGLIEDKLEHFALPQGFVAIGVVSLEEGKEVFTHHILKLEKQ